MLRITQGKGFQITFENGYTLSVQFGPMNYCENKNYNWSEPYARAASEAGERGSSNAEIAVIAPNKELLQIEPHDSVRGWVSPDEIARIMGIVATNPLSLVVRKSNEED